jgi:hypothetical protein
MEPALPDQLPVDPMPEVAEAVAVLDLVEDDRARSHIARNYPPCQWRDQVAAFMFLGFIGGADEEGAPICVAGNRDAWMDDLKARRHAEAAEAERRREANPRLQVEHDEHTAAYHRHMARRVRRRRGHSGAWGLALRERSIRLTFRARLGRARLALRRLVGATARPRSREHRARRVRPGARAPRGALAGDAGPEPEPRRGDR